LNALQEGLYLSPKSQFKDTFIYMDNELNRLYKESERCLSDSKKALCALRRLLGDKLGIRIDLEEE